MGTLSVRWPGLASHPLFDRQMALLDKLTREAGVGGRNVPSPVWQPLPSAMAYLTGGASGPVVTVHPLGGCAMGTSGCDGVVDEYGRVFAGDGATRHEGLVVLDGSIMPGSLGANPALTISALSLRAIKSLAIIWGLRGRSAQQAAHIHPRPRYRVVETVPPAPTRVEMHERLHGHVRLEGDVDCVVELTLTSEPVPVTALAGAGEKRLEVAGDSRLRIFAADVWERMQDEATAESRRDDAALLIATVKGHVDPFVRDNSHVISRTGRALWAWWLNRGMRDSWQAATQIAALPWTRRALDVLALASRAGEVRTIRYHLTVGEIEKATIEWPIRSGMPIEGIKRLTCTRGAVPLAQLSTLTLHRFPGLSGKRAAVLVLAPAHLARAGVPLLRIVEQRDGPTALLDLISLAGYVVRMLLSIHAWTLRLPDAPSRPPLRRLPERLPNVPVFEQYHVPGPEGSAHRPVVVTRYRNGGGRPVALFHGYSASGTTFAHECLEPSFAAYLWQQGRDVWVVDLRTSAGLITATEPWTFEQVANEDIPAAIEHIWRQTGKHCDVVAHCMGAAMFSMAMLSDDAAQRKMRSRIRRIVLSQVGPAVVFSPANIFRAWLVGVFRYFLSLERYDFRTTGANAPLDEQLLDRLLSLLPYPAHEVRLEQPLAPWRRVEFAGPRRRMDVLYGRDFSLGNVTPAFLDNIDAMFGPLHLETLSQALSFTRWQNITDSQGRNRYLHRHKLRQHWHHDTLLVHGRDNALSSVATLSRNRALMADAGVPVRTLLLDGFGHQDIWASGRSEAEVFVPIAGFLSMPEVPRARPDEHWLLPLAARPPYLGPILASLPTAAGEVTLRVGCSPNLGRPESICLVPVKREAGRLVAVEPLIDHLVVHDDVAMDDNGMVGVRFSRPSEGDGVLVCMLYDEHPALVDPAFSDAPVAGAMPARMWREGQELERRCDAARRLLQCPVSLLETGCVRWPQAPRMPMAAGGVSLEAELAFASCQYPAGPFDPVPAWAAWRDYHRALVSGRCNPDLLLLLGDQVYVDATADLFDPPAPEVRYRAPYERWLSAEPVQRVLARVPVFMTPDDHELENDWEPDGTAANRETLLRGEAAFRSFQFGQDPIRDSDKFWGEIAGAPLPIFMMNTRTDRQRRRLDDPAGARMVSDTQLAVLKSWLRSMPPDVPKIVSAASLPFPRRHRKTSGEAASLLLDGWGGYPATFKEVLGYIARQQIGSVIFLSGDEHVGIVATADLAWANAPPVRVWSIHAAPLYAPLPAANARAEDFIAEETFDVAPDVQCRVHADIVAGAAGFTSLRVHRAATGWDIQVRFETSGDTRVLTEVPAR